MNTKILICGLPESGKTTLAKHLQEIFEQCKGIDSKWYNADRVRKEYNDWDFSEEGRLRQALRMKELCSSEGLFIADFIAPTNEIRMCFDADFTIWMNTIETSKYEDTNKIFTTPNADLVIDNFDYDVKDIVKKLLRLEYFGIQSTLNILNIIDRIPEI